MDHFSMLIHNFGPVPSASGLSAVGRYYLSIYLKPVSK